MAIVHDLWHRALGDLPLTSEVYKPRALIHELEGLRGFLNSHKLWGIERKAQHQTWKEKVNQEEKALSPSLHPESS